MSEESGFEIDGRFYEVPSSFRACDPVLIHDVTGMEWDEFAAAQHEPTPRSTSGLIAVAVWQANPTWRRERVVRFMEQLAFEQIEFISPNGGDAVPPAQEEPRPDGSETSDEASTPESEPPSGSTPPPTGLLSSAISAT